MNNKLFARIAAAAVGVSMLATVAFAADPAPSVTEEGSLSFATETADKFTSDADQITLMAYIINDGTAVDPEDIPTFDEDTMTIVALDQVAGKDGFSVIPLDAELVGDAKEVIVKVGGTGINSPFETVLAIGEADAPAVLIGDVDDNGSIDDEDVYVLSMYTSYMWDEMLDQYGVDAESDAFVAAADADGSGSVDDEDVYVLSMYTSYMWDEIYDQYTVILGDMDPADYE